MKVTHPETGERLEGINLPYADPEWVWVLRDQAGSIVAYLVAMAGHRMMMMIHLKQVGDAPPLWALILLRAAMKDARSRGCEVFMTWLDTDVEPGRQLREICVSRGGVPWVMNGEVMAARIEWFVEGD